MHLKFENLEEEKRQRILNAAMKEFAAKGYDHASTNRIVETAGIAKGLLFHYFKSKKQLFLYLYDYCIELAQREMIQAVDFADRDFFHRLANAQMMKLKLILRYPDITEFLKGAYLEDSAAVKQELNERNRELMLLNFRKAFEGVDGSLFKPGLDVTVAINTVAWAFEGFANAYFHKMKHSPGDVPDYDTMFAEAREYAEFLKRCFYK